MQGLSKCVCWSQEPSKGSLWHQGSGCKLYFPLIWYSNMSLSHKVISTLLYNSLIICIDWLLNRLCFLHVSWFVLFWSWLYESTEAKQEKQIFGHYGSHRCPISTVQEPRRWFKAHLWEHIILAGPVWVACENAYAHVAFKKQFETKELTNEIKNFNHENVKDEELPLML